MRIDKTKICDKTKFAVRELCHVSRHPGSDSESQKLTACAVGRVHFGGVTRDAYLVYVPDAQPGDYVIVHVGFAISKVDAEEAHRTYELLEQMGVLAEELS